MIIILTSTIIFMMEFKPKPISHTESDLKHYEIIYNS